MFSDPSFSLVGLYIVIYKYYASTIFNVNTCLAMRYMLLPPDLLSVQHLKIISAFLSDLDHVCDANVLLADVYCQKVNWNQE